MSRHGPYRSAPPHPSIHRNLWSQHQQQQQQQQGGHVQCSDSRSTQSSGSSHTYHVLNGPRHDHYYHEPHRPEVGGGYTTCRAGGRHPLETPGLCPLPSESTAKYLLARPQRPPITTLPHDLLIVDNGRRSRPVSSRAVTPVSGGGGEPTVAIVPCGGHCVALESFCHYFLQVAFLGGVLSGLCLVVAGLVVRSELAVLTYIGSLAALVSALLLWVQCMVRRGPSRRHPHNRHPHRPPIPEAIPLQHLQPPPPPLRHIEPPQPPDFREESGIPWWRRENMIT